MTKILVVYGTTDGQTAKIAREIGVRLREAGADVQVRIASRDLEAPAAYDGVIVAASLHAGRFQAPVRQWVRAHASTLGQMPGAFVPVCLSVLDPAGAPELTRIVSRFLEECRWAPQLVKPVAGALLYRQYGWLKRWMMKRIVASKGGDTDTSRNYEYTDWKDVRRFADTFLDAVDHEKLAFRPNQIPTLARGA